MWVSKTRYLGEVMPDITKFRGARVQEDTAAGAEGQTLRCSEDASGRDLELCDEPEEGDGAGEGMDRKPRRQATSRVAEG